MGFYPAGQTICSAALMSHAVTQFEGKTTFKQTKKKVVTLLASCDTALQKHAKKKEKRRRNKTHSRYWALRVKKKQPKMCPYEHDCFGFMIISQTDLSAIEKLHVNTVMYCIAF